ncbi:MAG TPA: hypothetical protein VLY03_10830 [Bacteroidota bacterium]|nr:hypothetical protein [Bacteroidota bacterium]
MKRYTIAAAAGFAFFLLALAVPAKTNAQVHVNVGFVLGGPQVHTADPYWASLENRYHVSYRDLCEMRDAGIRDADMPRILFIYTHSHYSLRQIYSLRRNGATWVQLSTWCGVPLNHEYGLQRAAADVHPHDRAWGSDRSVRERDNHQRDRRDSNDR